MAKKNLICFQEKLMLTSILSRGVKLGCLARHDLAHRAKMQNRVRPSHPHFLWATHFLAYLVWPKTYWVGLGLVPFLQRKITQCIEIGSCLTRQVH